MPHPEREHELQIALATALRERDEALADIKSICVVLGWGNVPPLASIERDIRSLKEALAAANARADAAAAKAEQYERDWYAAKNDFGNAMAKSREALAAARRECEGLRAHLRRMVDWADLHVNEVEAIAAASKDPDDARRARAARAEYDFAEAALAAPGDGEEGTR